MRPWVLVLIAACVPCLAPASEDGPPQQHAASGWERYRVLGQRNIFAKDRGRARPRLESNEEMGPPAPKLESEVVLTGILQKDGQLVAFFENTRTRTVQAVRKDDVIGRGKIAAISLDGIEYVCDGTSFSVSIGKTLEGGASTRAGSESGASSGSAETNAILERLRKKRQEEMSK
jgi:hypothetical protein